MTTKPGKRAVTVFLTEEHLHKMVSNHLLKEEEMADHVKIAGIVQKLFDNDLGLPDKKWHDWDAWAQGLQ